MAELRHWLYPWNSQEAANLIKYINLTLENVFLEQNQFLKIFLKTNFTFILNENFWI